MGKLSVALNAIFSTSGDAGLTSAMKIPYFKSKTVDGTTAFFPDGLTSVANLASVLGANAMWSSIPQNTDLDNILAANSKYGMYCFHCAGSSVSNTLSNKPSNIIATAFHLIVFKEFSDSFGYCTQIIVQNGRIWLRNNTSSVWQGWKEVSST